MNKFILQLIVLFSTFLFAINFSACKKDELPVSNYNIVTGTITDISNTGAKVSGSLTGVNGTTILKYGHVWSTNQNPTTDLATKTEYGSITADTNYTSSISSLNKGTNYYVRAYATDNNGTYYGEKKEFLTTENFFQFKVSNTYLLNDETNKIRAWVMVYSSDGVLLNMAEIFNGNTYNFDWPANNTSDRYYVQIFKESIRTGALPSNYYTLFCYLDVRPDFWFLGNESSTTEEPDQLGTNYITLTDIYLFDYYMFEARNKYTFGDIGSENISFDQYFNPDNIFIMYMEKGEAPYYKWFDNVELNDSYTISSSEFTKMTDYVDITFPAGNDYCRVYIESEDDLSTDFWEYYMVYYYSVSNGQSILRSFYPGNLFSGYYTSLSASMGNVNESMIRLRGTIPNQFISIPADITLYNSSVLNFNSSITGNADYTQQNWFYEIEGDSWERFNYGIIGSLQSVQNYMAPELPDEIKLLNEPLLDLNELNFTATIFNEYDNINGFNDYINKIFVLNEGLYDDALIEYYRKIISVENGKGMEINEDLNQIQNQKKNPYIK